MIKNRLTIRIKKLSNSWIDLRQLSIFCPTLITGWWKVLLQVWWDLMEIIANFCNLNKLLLSMLQWAIGSFEWRVWEKKRLRDHHQTFLVSYILSQQFLTLLIKLGCNWNKLKKKKKYSKGKIHLIWLFISKFYKINL